MEYEPTERGGAKMAAAAAAPLLIHSEEAIDESLILISPFAGSLWQRRLPPEGVRPAPPPLQLLKAASEPETPES